MDEASSVYMVNPVVAIEDFGERSLVLHCVDLRMVELNATARRVVSMLDGQTSLRQVATAMADDYGQPLETVLNDVQTLAAQMVELGIIQPAQQAPDEKPDEEPK